jgi:predicted DNA binding CopG/RHH family protein
LSTGIIKSESLAQDIGERGKRSMNKTIKYTNKPIGDIKIIDDFLPSPKDLVLKEENVKITISLTKQSIDFFKEEAKKHHTQYQKMIRNLLDTYVKNYSQSDSKVKS